MIKSQLHNALKSFELKIWTIMDRLSTRGQSGRGETRSESFNFLADQSKTLTIKMKHQVVLRSSLQNTLILFDIFDLFI